MLLWSPLPSFEFRAVFHLDWLPSKANASLLSYLTKEMNSCLPQGHFCESEGNKIWNSACQSHFPCRTATTFGFWLKWNISYSNLEHWHLFFCFFSLGSWKFKQRKQKENVKCSIFFLIFGSQKANQIKFSFAEMCYLVRSAQVR